MFSQLVQLAAFVIPLVLAGPHGNAHVARHHEIAKRLPGELQVHDFGKRFSGSRWSYYAVGLGACGETNGPSDFIVALNADQFGSGYPGPNCFKMITMNYNGKTAQAQIMDRCPGCPYGGLDLSEGLFRHFDSLDKGIIHGSWTFNDAAPEPEPEPSPEPTTTWKPDPTTTWTPDPTTTTTRHSTTSTSEEETTTTSHTTTSTTSSETTTSSSTTSSSSSTTTTAAAATGNIDSMEQVVVKFGEMAVVAYQS